MRRLPVLVLLLLVPCLLAPAAHGTVVYSKKSSIWAMNDDGTNKRQLFDRSAVPGTDKDLLSPRVAPGGDTILFWSNGEIGGNPCEGIYSWKFGAASAVRESEPPGGGTCNRYEQDGDIAADGRFFFERVLYSGGSQMIFDTVIADQIGQPQDQGGYDATCRNEEFSGGDPAINPGNSQEMVFWCKNAGELRRAAGPNAQATLVLNANGNTLSDPAYSPDGTQIVTVLKGQNGSELVKVNLATGQAVEMIVVASSLNLHDPAFMGDDRIVAEVSNSAGADIISISAGCTLQTCNSDAALTKLTTDGGSGPDWTGNALAAATPPPPGDQNPNPAPTGPNPTPTPTNPGAVPPVFGTFTAPATIKAQALVTNGLKVGVEVGVEGSRVEATLTKGAGPRALSSAAAKPLVRVVRTKVAAGKLTLKLKIPKKQRKALLRAKKTTLTLRVTVTPPGAVATVKTKKVVVKR